MQQLNATALMPTCQLAVLAFVCSLEAAYVSSAVTRNVRDKERSLLIVLLVSSFTRSLVTSRLSATAWQSWSSFFLVISDAEVMPAIAISMFTARKGFCKKRCQKCQPEPHCVLVY
jgi:hypothetical protein